MTISTSDIIDLFKDGILSLSFPNLDTQAGNELLELIAKYIIQCMDAQYIHDNCPKLYECYITHYMAYIIVTWQMSISDDGEIVTEPVLVDPIMYLKSQNYGGKECEWAVLKAGEGCVNCDDKVINQWSLKMKSIADTCKLASRDIGINGGSNYPDNVKSDCGACGSDRSFISWEH